TSKPACQFDAVSALSDCKTNLIGVKINLSTLFFIVQLNGGAVGRAERASDIECIVVGIIDYVTVFIAQFANDSVNPGTFYSHAGTSRINTVIVRFNGYFRPFSWLTNNIPDADQPVKYFRDLQLK